MVPLPNYNAAASSDALSITNGESKPRLREEGKEQSLIAPEQERRVAIREGFKRLTEIVPGLDGQSREEGLVLEKTVEFMRHQLGTQRAIIARIEEKGGAVDPAFKL